MSNFRFNIKRKDTAMDEKLVALLSYIEGVIGGDKYYSTLNVEAYHRFVNEKITCEK